MARTDLSADGNQIMGKHVSRNIQISRWSMRSKLFMTIIALVCLIDALVFLYFPAHFLELERTCITENARNTAGLLAEQLYRRQSSQQTAEQFLASHQGRVRFILVFDEEGRELVALNRDIAEAAGYSSATGEGVYVPASRMLLIRTNIAWSAQGSGVMILGYTSEVSEQRIDEMHWVTLFLGIVVLLAGCIAAYFISRMATRPLRKVAAAVESIAAGNLSERIAVESSDDVGRVASAFNAMVENLEFAYRELRATIGDLQRKADDLQKEVIERERAVERMRESEHRFRILSDAAFEGIALAEENLLVDANDQLASMLGFDQKELVGRNLLDLAAPASREALRAIDKGSAGDAVELMCIRKDGSLFPVEVRAREVAYGGRRFRVAAIRDITERKKGEEALRRAHGHLERKVGERTAELSETNSALQKEIVERTAVAAALRESEERYRSLVNNMKEVVFQADAEGRWVFLNSSWTGITGFSEEGSVGRKLEEFVHEDDRSLIAEIRARLLDQRLESCHKEIRYRTVDGRYRRLEMFARADRNSDLQSIGISGTLRDVTELREAERALRESRDFINKIVNSVGDPLFVKDRQHRWVLLNDSMCSFVGRQREELLGRSDYDFFPKSEAELFWARDEEVFASGQENISEEQFTDAYGVTHSIMTKKNLYDDGKGQPHIVGVIRDVSVLKEAERQIRKMNEDLERRVAVRTFELQTANKELLREIAERKRVEAELRKLIRAVEQSPSSVVITDLYGNIEYVNPKFVQITGYDPEEVLGKNPRMLKSGQTPPEEYKIMWRAIAAGHEWRGEFQNRKKNGEIFWEQASISPIKNTKGEVTHFIAVKEDITERKALEAQFRRTQRLEIIGTLAGGIAHDLNNVLAPILMGIQILRMKVGDDKGRQVLATIEASANRGADIVKQVLTFARGVEGERSAIQVKHLLREVEEIVHETFPRSIQVVTHVPKDLWVVKGDATQLHQVLMNLCVNARDAMADGGTLSIRGENIILDERGASLHLEAKQGPYILLVVSDTGVGISPRHLEKIFDPFFTTKEIGKGTGLGLSTVQAIAKSHGGFVTVYSELGKGTQFKVYLPAGDARAVASPEAAPAEIPRGNGEGILVVDDEHSVREITREILITYGYDVLLARDGFEALNSFRQHRERIHVVLTDMMMPQMDGATLIRELQLIDPDVRIIAASGLANYESSSELHSANVQAFLTKPYKAEKLLWVLNTVLK